VYEDVEPLTDASPDADARQQVTALFEAHALGLVKLAKVMLGDQSTAEDIVQDAFAGVYRKWASLQDRDKALGYLRASVLNGCRTAHRSRTRRDRALLLAPEPDGIVSAEESALVGEANREVLAALRSLPARQREAVVCGTMANYTYPASTAGCGPSLPEFVAYSAATGQRLRVLQQYTGDCYEGTDIVLWADAAARHVIGESYIMTKHNPLTYSDHYGVAANGTFAPFKVAQHGQWYSGPEF
jgi:RNA polymerase sigma factor (sigma-70 family)